MIHQIVPQIFRRMGRAFAGRNGASCAKDMFLQRTERVCRRNGSSCAKTLFRVGRGLAFADEMGLRVRRHFFALDGASRSQTKWVFVCEEHFSRWTGPRV